MKKARVILDSRSFGKDGDLSCIAEIDGISCGDSETRFHELSQHKNGTWGYTGGSWCERHLDVAKKVRNDR